MGARSVALLDSVELFTTYAWPEWHAQCAYANTMAGEYKVTVAAVNCICLIIGKLDRRRDNSFN
jgi:hypothetical protein